MHSRLTGALIAVLALAVAGCAANPTPIVDTKGVDPELYAADRTECQVYTEEISIAAGAAKGAIAGAGVGVITGVVFEGGIDSTAAIGGIYGGTRSALDADREQQEVWKTCMQGRGYRVLN